MSAESAVHGVLATVQKSAVHLEMRDVYPTDDPLFKSWLAGATIDPATDYRGWFDLIVATVARGVQVRRARVVSEPVTDYIRFEYEITAGHNVAAGEQVRWLPRRRASDLALPGNDFWLFDDRMVIFNHFAGDGGSLADGEEVSTDPAIASQCRLSFESVWARAIPHARYRPS